MIEYKGKKYSCNVEVTIDLIGGKWKPVILWHLMHNKKRFNEMRRMIPQITTKMLTQQLKELEEDGLVDRKIFAEIPPKVEYSITEAGLSVKSVLEAMCKWGRAYRTKNDEGVSEKERIVEQ